MVFVRPARRALIFALLILMSAHLRSQAPPPAVDAPYAPDQMLVRFAADVTAADADARAAQVGARVIRNLESEAGVYLLQLPAGLDPALHDVKARAAA